MVCAKRRRHDRRGAAAIDGAAGLPVRLARGDGGGPDRGPRHAGRARVRPVPFVAIAPGAGAAGLRGRRACGWRWTSPAGSACAARRTVSAAGHDVRARARLVRCGGARRRPREARSRRRNGEPRGRARGRALGGRGHPRRAMTDITIIVPVFNAARTLDACLDSLERQDLSTRTREIIVVDNNSTDATPRSRVVTRPSVSSAEPRQSAYAARNHGLRAARGRWIVFTDGDCVPRADWLRRLTSPLDDPSVQVVMGRDRPAGTTTAVRLLGEYDHRKELFVLRSRDPAVYYGHEQHGGTSRRARRGRHVRRGCTRLRRHLRAPRARPGRGCGSLPAGRRGRPPRDRPGRRLLPQGLALRQECAPLLGDRARAAAAERRAAAHLPRHRRRLACRGAKPPTCSRCWSQAWPATTAAGSSPRRARPGARRRRKDGADA